MKAGEQHVIQSKLMEGSAVDIGKTEIYFNRDNNNIAPNNQALNVLGINQSFQMPSLYKAHRKVLEGKTSLISSRNQINKRIIAKEVSKAYHEIVYLNDLLRNFTSIDSLYSSFQTAIGRKFEQGESTYLDKLTAETKKKEISLKINQIKENIEKSYIVMNQYMQIDTAFEIENQSIFKLELAMLDTTDHPVLKYYDEAKNLVYLETELEEKKKLPEWNTTFFVGANNGSGQKAFLGFQLGMAIPIWKKAINSRIMASKSGSLALDLENSNYMAHYISSYKALLSDLRQYQDGLDYYNSTGEKLAAETIFHADKAFENGDINVLQYVQLIENAKNIKVAFLYNLFQYNNAVIDINYLTILP